MTVLDRAIENHLRLNAAPAAVPWARRFTRDQLDQWRLGSLAGDGALVVSELVTNALAASAIVLRLRWTGSQLYAEVWDDAPEVPRPAAAGPADEGGRGLVLVAAYADQWGWYGTQGGKVTWARWNVPASRG